MDSKSISRRQFLRLGALSAAGAALAACAPQVITERETVEVPVEVTREVEVPSEPQVTTIVEQAEPITLRIEARLGDQGDHFNKYAHLYNEEHHPNVFVKTELFSDADYYQKLDTMLAGGTIGDAFWIWLGNGFDQYAATGIYAALDDIVASKDYDLNQFYPESIEALRYEGNLYALPYLLNIGSGSDIYYNKTMFDEAGVEYPALDWTWDEMIETAKVFSKPDEGIFGLVTSNYYGGSPPAAARAYGGDLLSADGTKTNIDAPGTVEGMRVFSDLFHVHGVTPTTAELAGSAYQMFAAGKLAMFQSGFWGKVVDDYVAPDSWGVVGTPLGPAGRGLVMFVDNVGVTAASKYPAETFEYLTYVCGYEAGMELWRDYRSVPGCRPDIWESEEALADPHFKVNTEMLQAEGMPPRLPCPANFREKEYWQVVNEGLEPIWTGERTFDEVMPDVVQAGQEILDRPSLLT